MLDISTPGPDGFGYRVGDIARQLPQACPGCGIDNTNAQAQDARTMKMFLQLILALAILPLTLSAKDVKEKVPAGYIAFSDLAKAQEKALASKKLIAVLAKGADDNCPHCVTAMNVGQTALRNDCVLVFTRAEGLSNKTGSLSEAAKSGLDSSPTGASVTFVVFTPDMSAVVAKLGRGALENDKKAVAEMKKTVSAARKALTAAK